MENSSDEDELSMFYFDEAPPLEGASKLPKSSGSSAGVKPEEKDPTNTRAVSCLCST